MQASNVPTKSAVPFANSGAKNTIPVASQIGITPGLASFTDGFPPLTMTPLAAGGIPPYGQDFNGILNFLSAGLRWAQAGGSYTYDAAFSTAIGGYPKGAVLVNAAGTGFWLCGVDNNTTNPDSGGANWSAVITNLATTTVAGIVRLATNAETQTGTSAVLGVTPAGLQSRFIGSNQSFGANGFQRLPGGLILQWGNISANSGGSLVTFPIQFPTACRSVLTCHGSSGSPVATSFGSITATSCIVYLASGTAGTVYYQAMGD